MKFKATVIPSGNALGVEVPQDVIDELGQGKRPPVVVGINGHSWRTRVAAMRGQILIGISAANREASGVDLGEEIEVELRLDEEPRVVEAPDDLAAVLDADPALRGAYERMAFSLKRKQVGEIESAKSPETRQRRIDKLVESLRGK
ncbi:YdeI/OmpD-associated family protein [Streptomyces sp. YS-3]|uniref:YdeI/OmpD-associated family protein n=1 Tax=Streptomyces sp. YS-3 TaxID=3381352 RepID=UPI0038623474